MKIPALTVAARAAVADSPELRKDLTFYNKKGDMVQMYEEWKGKLLVPRGLTEGGFDCTYGGLPFVQSVACPPRTQEQEEVINASVEYLSTGKDHIVCAPTGFGKTYVGAAIACRMQRKTLIIVTKNDLVKSWYDTLTKLIGVDPSRIGQVQQSTYEVEGKYFVIGMLHSLVIPHRYPSNFYSSMFGLVIFDECHRLGANEFSKACSLFSARYRLGLSATPKRWDQMERLFEAHIGPVLVTGKTVPMKPDVVVRHTPWQASKGYRKNKTTGVWELKDIDVSGGRMMPLYKQLLQSEERNNLITNFVLKAYRKGRRTVVMGDIVDHLVRLQSCFSMAGIKLDDMDFYIGKRTQAELDIAKTKPVVLATYAFTGEGTDVPEWDTLVMVTPRANILQPAGRILRWLEGKKTPVVFDLVDAHPVFIKLHNARLKQYAQLGAKIITVTS